MNLKFDYYHNLQSVELYLCNPDGKELYNVVGFDRKVTLRFNDLSELSFSCYEKTTSSSGETIKYDFYDWLETHRLIKATDIGWFVITNVSEIDDGFVKRKDVSCESLQATLKNRGFYCEERVYYFYNPNDPTDAYYDPKDDEGVPSVVGQLYRQLGINAALSQGLSTPSEPYKDWTITYVNSDLYSLGRNFKKSTSYGYDWIVKDVAKAFEVVILFDFFYKTIKVMKASEVTSDSGVVFSFSNFMKEIKIEESAENIVTVMDCNGNNCDIVQVNPTGTNYICDFSYYADEDKAGRWMSTALKNKLAAWKTAVANAKPGYDAKIAELKNACASYTGVIAPLQEISKIYTDLQTALAKKMSLGDSSNGIPVWGENVDVGQTSRDIMSRFHSSALSLSTTITAYKAQPTFMAGIDTYKESQNYSVGDFCKYNDKIYVCANATTGTWSQDNWSEISRFVAGQTYNNNSCCLYNGIIYKNETGNSITDQSFDETKWTPKEAWSCSGESSTGTIEECYNNGFLYFIDPADGSSTSASYCKLDGKASVNRDTWFTVYTCKGFKRYIGYGIVNTWMSIYDSERATLQSAKEGYESDIETLRDELDAISSDINILNYFSDTPALLKELMCYWIEGEYTNDNIAILDDTTQEEEIDLCKQLLESGEVELAKVCKPKLQFSLSAIDCTKLYEFKDQVNKLELGKIIAVEKEDGVWYYPALLEMEYDLDETESFNLKFANALRLDDWGYTYADLLSNASSTSRQVSANWQNITSYSKSKDRIESLILQPLSSTLRAATANMTNQEFTIDETGILGRKFYDGSHSSFTDEQMRISNNAILFTRNGWETVETALGKVTYNDDGQQVTAYGLIGQAIIGDLIMGNKLKIRDEDGKVVINGSGITVNDNNNNPVFKVSKVDGFQLYSNNVCVMNVTSSGAEFNGKLEVKDAAANTLFKADVQSHTLGIGNWNVDRNSFSFPDPNDGIFKGTFICSGSEGYASIGGSPLLNEWCIGVGGNFGVTKDGECFVKRLVVGDSWEISNLQVNGGQIIGEISTDSGTFSDYVLSKEYRFVGGGTIKPVTAGNPIYTEVSFTAKYKSIDHHAEQIQMLTITITASQAIPEDTNITTTIAYKSLDDNKTHTANKTATMSAGRTTVTCYIYISFDLSGQPPRILSCRLTPTNKTYVSGAEFSGIGVDATFLPATDDYYDLGAGTKRWDDIYATNGTIQTSDRREKEDISILDDRFDALFDLLNPVSFKFTNGKSKRTHIGLVAQDVESAMKLAGFDEPLLAALIIDDGRYGLRYTEFISLCIYEIQLLKSRIEELKTNNEKNKGTVL